MAVTEHIRVTQWHELLTKVTKVLNVEAVNVLTNRIQRQTSVSSSSSLLPGTDTEDIQRDDLRGHPRKKQRSKGGMIQGGTVVNKMVLSIRCCNGPPELTAIGKLLEVVQKRCFWRHHSREETNKAFWQWRIPGSGQALSVSYLFSTAGQLAWSEKLCWLLMPTVMDKRTELPILLMGKHTRFLCNL